MTGRDTKGVTAMINSVTKLDFGELPNGSVMDVTPHPSAVGGEDGLAGFVALLGTFFATGGFGIQFNVVDAGTLRDAQARPELHSRPQIRVCGYSAHFTKLSRYEQDQFIARLAHGV